MNKITVSARTVEDAITEASIQLGLASTEFEYEVIEKGSAGFLGIGAKQAVITAWKKEEKKQHPKKEFPKKEFSKKEEPKKPEIKEKEPVKEVKIEKAQEVKEEKEVPEKEEKLAEVCPQTKEACEKFLYDVFKTMDMEVKIVSEIDEEGALSISMEGENMGILIGKRGQTLDSLQYLTNRVANKMQDGYVRVKLDTENYRQRRKDTLENLAKNIAHKVKRTKRAVSLEPMNPYERRIIHSALQNDKFVETHSEGEEPYRKIVVTLKKGVKDYSRNYGYNKNSYRKGSYGKSNYRKQTYQYGNTEETETPVEKTEE